VQRITGVKNETHHGPPSPIASAAYAPLDPHEGLIFNKYKKADIFHTVWLPMLMAAYASPDPHGGLIFNKHEKGDIFHTVWLH